MHAIPGIQLIYNPSFLVLQMNVPTQTLTCCHNCHTPGDKPLHLAQMWGPYPWAIWASYEWSRGVPHEQWCPGHGISGIGAQWDLGCRVWSHVPWIWCCFVYVGAALSCVHWGYSGGPGGTQRCWGPSPDVGAQFLGHRVERWWFWPGMTEYVLPQGNIPLL